MAITEEGLYKAFGLTPPAEPGEQVQEVAAPDQATGAQVQEVAVPDNDDPTGGISETVAGSADNNDQAEPPAGDLPLSPQQRRENAARRRKQEQQAAIDAAVAAERATNNQLMEQLIRDLQLQNPVTGEPITTFDEYQAFRRQQSNESFARKVGDGSLVRSDIEQIVQEQFQQLQEQAQQQAAAVQARQLAQEQIDQELLQIQQMDASITCFADLLEIPNAEEFREKIGKGYSLIDAFKLVRGPELQQAQAEAARNAAMRNANGKAHLSGPNGGRGDGTVPVPQDELRMYRMFNPHASDADILKHFNENRK